MSCEKHAWLLSTNIRYKSIKAPVNYLQFQAAYYSTFFEIRLCSLSVSIVNEIENLNYFLETLVFLPVFDFGRLKNTELWF